MKTRVFIGCLASFLALATLAWAADPAPGKIRVLLTHGGHAFETVPFFALFDSIPDVVYTKAEMPKAAELLKPGLEKQYDVLVMYDMNRKITPEQQAAFIALLNKGIGGVSLHHNVGANADWPEFRKIIGGKFVFADAEIDGTAYKKTPWKHDETLDVTIADKQHPITRGLKDFTIHDETYGKFYVAPGVHVLLTTKHPNNNPELAWVTKYGNSPVVYLMLGHDGKAYENPNYVELVSRSIRFAAGRLRD